MQGLTEMWTSLDRRARIMAGGATLIAFLLILGLSLMNNAPKMALLYAGLDGSAAGEVISALDQQRAVYEVRGDSVFVAAERRDELRMLLAGEGLPAMGAQGYELLDKLSGFGTTSQMFDAAYWRAKEGELARTILANPSVRSARVHISTPVDRPFRSSEKASAAVTVTANGDGLAIPQARALRYLIAAAVSGLSPEDVAVIDDSGGLIPSGLESESSGAPDPRIAEIKSRVERLLEARVGYGNAVVEVSLEAVTDRESIVERRFDPDSRVAISTESEEATRSEDGTSGGQVTVASNLPEGEGQDSAKTSSKSSETRERSNFEVSETQREIIRTPGAIKRLTVAVLVNEPQAAPGADGSQTPARSTEELAALRELVASAVGFDEARGDTITLKSMQFRTLPQNGTPPVSAPGVMASIDTAELAKLGVIGLIVLLLGLFVLRPILTARSNSVGALPAPDTSLGDLPTNAIGAADDMPDFASIDPPALDFEGFDTDSSMGMAMPSLDDAASDDPVGKLRGLIGERQEETLQLLESWIGPAPEAERS